ncbi:MAG TPA: hypothetical protein PLJ30_05605 [Deltaproteobacteria bacterium]|nr:hypothetical protein [Deltaproteobacteria bacterium]
MMERELRKKIHDTALELKEVKTELGRRYENLMKVAKPLVLLVVGYIGLKTALWIIGTLISLAWKYMLLFFAMVGFLLLRRRMASQP